MKNNKRGYTLLELTLGMALMGIVSVAFASLLKYVMRSTVVIETQGGAQEDVRQALMKIEESLLHANEVRVASAAFVEYVVDADQSPERDRSGDSDADGIPNYLDADVDNDAGLLAAPTAQWRIGFNLKDDDEDGDGLIDVRKRLYLEGEDLWIDASLNEAPWGGPFRKRVATGVSGFALAYFGNKGNALGRNIDLGGDGVASTADAGESDGIIAAAEMDMAPPPSGMGNRNGALDAQNERRYITSIRLSLSIDRNRDGKTDNSIETDIYPPLLPLKAQ